MGSFKLGTMTLKSIFKKPETVLYPVMEKSAPDGLKGHIANDMDVCILCGICQKTCPAGALRVVKAENLWAIDRFACVQCGACTRACPKSCLTMEPTYQKPTATKQEDVFYKSAEDSSSKTGDESPKADKIADETPSEKAQAQSDES